MLYTRGSTLRSTMEFLGRALDAERVETVLARLAPAERATVETTSVTADVVAVPAELLERVLPPVERDDDEHRDDRRRGQ